MNEPLVILVDENDIQTGTAFKLEAHEKALLHRAVSVFVMNSKGEWLLQRRAFDKYHSNGLWTNTCCTHPFPGESPKDAATRRLYEEMGLKCEPEFLFSFIYNEKLDNELTEHEYDHVFFCITDDLPLINKSEVEEWKYVTFEKLAADVMQSETSYTYWFRKIFNDVKDHIGKINKQC
jgi:isopentenyl-diphosphate Delta-isomerase